MNYLHPIVLLGALLSFAGAAHAEVKRYFSGNAEDVQPKLHGPAHHFQGGGTDVDAAFQWMFDQVRGCTDCDTKLDVVVLRAYGDGGYNEYLLEMKGVDSVETLVIDAREDSNRPDVVSTVRNAEIIFFSGGDQCNYVRYFKGTPVEIAVESVYERGGGISGTSAGDAIMGEFLYDACTGSTRSFEALSDPYHRSITFTSDFFHWKHMEGTFTDQHLVERNRMGRTFAFLARQIRDGKTKSVLGVAADRETSVAVDRNGLATILGKGPAYFILADHMPEVCEPGRPLTYSNFKIWKRDAGETFDLKTRPASGYYTRSVERGVIDEDPYAPTPCEPSARVRQVLADARDFKSLLTGLPEDLFVIRAYQDSLEPAKALEVSSAFLSEQSGDPRSLYLLARALLRSNSTQKAIATLEEAIQADPQFPLPYLEMAAAYAKTDAAGVKEPLENVMRMCPYSFEPYRYVESSGDAEFIERKARELRRFLYHATGDERLEYYGTLWPMEMRITSEEERTALREQFGEDVRLLLAEGRDSNTPGGTPVTEEITIGGTTHELRIRDSGQNHPVLLISGSVPQWLPALWEESFTVVNTDMENTEEVVSHLRTRFRQEKIVLLAFSSGIARSARLAQKHPEWFHAIVQVGMEEMDESPFEFTIPVLMMMGKKDPLFESAQRYFNRLAAPRKRFLTFQHSSSSPMLEEPGGFLMALVEEVLPLAR